MTNKLTGVGYFAAGAGIGAVLGLLFAPRAGKHTRARILNSANRTLHRVDEMREDVRGYMSELVDDVSDTIASNIGSCKEKAEGSKERIQQTLDRVRGRIDESRKRVEDYVRSVAG